MPGQSPLGTHTFYSESSRISRMVVLVACLATPRSWLSVRNNGSPHPGPACVSHRLHRASFRYFSGLTDLKKRSFWRRAMAQRTAGGAQQVAAETYDAKSVMRRFNRIGFKCSFMWAGCGNVPQLSIACRLRTSLWPISALLRRPRSSGRGRTLAQVADAATITHSLSRNCSCPENVGPGRLGSTAVHT
jgi:hypothetical protein